MNTEKLKGIAIGFLAAAVVFSVAGAVHASVGTFQLNATYANIKIYVDGKPIEPKDVKGDKVEPFIVSGTTYLPVRAVSEALGKDVEWDAENRAVYIGSFPASLNALREPQTAETALRKWVSAKGADLTGLLEEYFGAGAKVTVAASGNKLTLEVNKRTRGLTDEERLKQSDDFTAMSSALTGDYQEMLELIRGDTGFKGITMNAWHYFDEKLILMQELS
ncbi:MAG: copper amine oxidase N-terminal domain-containing protein [Clostridiales Family XIII bacterium]|jgi:hypothetical protein|nr:copper amine oxidase N-terminal domain-containing protein [Clostridiales Family XIII bacterium]